MEDLEKDVRLIRRQLAKGFISTAKAESDREALPDVADKGEWLDPEAEFEEDIRKAAAAAEADGDDD